MASLDVANAARPLTGDERRGEAATSLVGTETVHNDGRKVNRAHHVSDTVGLRNLEPVA
jgi:hypothetical protein